MAKANIDLPNGTKIIVDGTSDDINAVLKLFTNTSAPTPSADKKKNGKRKSSSHKKSGVKRTQKGPNLYILEIKEDGFFDKKKTINDIQQKLEENGHIYPQTHLSTPLRRLVQKKELRRIKEDGNWVYVKA